MKKFLCMTMLMLVTLTASAMAQTKAASPPGQDIGYQQAATLSLDGMTVTIATPAALIATSDLIFKRDPKENYAFKAILRPYKKETNE